MTDLDYRTVLMGPKDQDPLILSLSTYPKNVADDKVMISPQVKNQKSIAMFNQ